MAPMLNSNCRSYGLASENMPSNEIEWIPGVDWIAGLLGAAAIAALLWVAVALA
jgi:hypothetical protein